VEQGHPSLGNRRCLVTRRERRVYIHQAFLIIANLMSCLS